MVSPKFEDKVIEKNHFHIIVRVMLWTCIYVTGPEEQTPFKL